MVVGVGERIIKMSKQEVNRCFENEVSSILERMEKLNDSLNEIVDGEGYELTNSQIELADKIKTNLVATIVLQGLDKMLDELKEVDNLLKELLK